MDTWALVLAWSIPGIFGLKLVFWDIPLRFDHYWKGVATGLSVSAALVIIVYLFTNYFLIGLIVAVIALIIIWAFRS